jgi:uncharacterized membrane protein YkoI
MKTNHVVGLAAGVLLVLGGIGAMGANGSRVFAQAPVPGATQAAATTGTEKEALTTTPDTDQVDTQVDEQKGSTSGPELANETNETGEVAGKDAQDAAPTGTPAITADAALKAAQAYLGATATGKATLDDENGTLVYSVGINGQDVKVNVMTGLVLTVDQPGEVNH